MSLNTMASARLGFILAAICAACICLSPGLGFAEEKSPTITVSEYMHPISPPDVPECDRVEDAHFARALLVGDSLSDGIGIHNVIPEMQLMTRIGLTPQSAATEKLFKNNGKAVTLAQKLPVMRPSAVYLWLGSNGLVSKDADQVIKEYSRLLNRLLAALPNTPFYLLEVTPVQRLSQKQYATFTNERIDAFNTALHGLAEQHNVYVLPINSILQDEEGYLREEYAAEDGVHLRKPAYEAIAAYLYTHALPPLETPETLEEDPEVSATP